MLSTITTNLATELASAMRDIMEDSRSREAVPPPTQNSQTESPAPSIDSYSISNVSVMIGSGSDSQVIVAFHATTGTPVAIKVVPKVMRQPEQVQRSRFEGLLISSILDHPNIVKGYPILEDDEKILIPMELSPMGDLLSLVNRRQGLHEDESRLIFRQLVEGLGHAHSKGVLHGDIKLDNVRVSATEEHFH
jgi:serine/threonine protein kinase